MSTLPVLRDNTYWLNHKLRLVSRLFSTIVMAFYLILQSDSSDPFHDFTTGATLRFERRWPDWLKEYFAQYLFNFSSMGSISIPDLFHFSMFGEAWASGFKMLFGYHLTIHAVAVSRCDFWFGVLPTLHSLCIEVDKAFGRDSGWMRVYIYWRWNLYIRLYNKPLAYEELRPKKTCVAKAAHFHSLSSIVEWV